MTNSFSRTLLLSVAAVAGMFLIDTFMATAERNGTRTEAGDLAREGRQLLAAGQGREAAGKFQAAIFLVRQNQDYHLGLADAQLAAGELPEAEATLREVLAQDADGGPANLAMARVLAREDRMTEAFSWYHRAIYGQWRNDAAANRLRARFELVDLLAARHAREGLLAELLPLQAEAPDDDNTRLRIAPLFLAAGSPNRAALVFREVLKNQPRNPDAWAGLAEAEFAVANYRTALADFQSALRHRPDDAALRTRRDTCQQVLELDPAQRGLGIEEQQRRSVKILSLILDTFTGCAAPPDLSAAAQKAVKERVSASRLSAAYEANLDLAGKLWQARTPACTTPPPEFLALTLRKLAQ